MKTDFLNIKPEKHYMRYSGKDVFTGRQILNLLEIAEPVMQAIILLDIVETDEPVNRFGKYGMEIGR